MFTKNNFSFLTGLVIAAGILIRKEAIMILTEVVKEIARLQAATAYTGEFWKLKIYATFWRIFCCKLNKICNQNRSATRIFFVKLLGETNHFLKSNKIILNIFSYNNEIKTAEEIQQFLSSKKTEKPMQTSGSSASNSNQTTDVFGFISTG